MRCEKRDMGPLQHWRRKSGSSSTSGTCPHHFLHKLRLATASLECCLQGREKWRAKFIPLWDYRETERSRRGRYRSNHMHVLGCKHILEGPKAFAHLLMGGVHASAGCSHPTYEREGRETLARASRIIETQVENGGVLRSCRVQVGE